MDQVEAAEVYVSCPPEWCTCVGLVLTSSNLGRTRRLRGRNSGAGAAAKLVPEHTGCVNLLAKLTFGRFALSHDTSNTRAGRLGHHRKCLGPSQLSVDRRLRVSGAMASATTLPPERRYRHEDAFVEAGGWFRAFFHLRIFGGRWRLARQFQRPHMYLEPAHAEKKREEFTTVDGLGRIKHKNTSPFECTINPDSGKFEPLLVQAPKDICNMDNSTWRRTVIRNGSPIFLRVANLPYKFVDRSRRNNTGDYEILDWATVILMWPVAMAAFILYVICSHFSACLLSNCLPLGH